MIFHPRFKTLSRYASRTLGHKSGIRVARHLADCTSCRQTVSQLRRLSEVAEQLPDPEVPNRAWEEIVSRRERGERVILPTVDPEPLSVRSSPGRYLVIAASAVLLVYGGLMLFRPVPEAEALKSELRFQLSDSQKPVRIEVEYRAGPALAGESRLNLRARHRTPLSGESNEGPVQRTVATLVRESDGIFRGSFQLPESVVYSSFAVEDLDGNGVDHNGRLLWELLSRLSDGRPSYDALDQKKNDLLGRNWELAFETAREMTSLYPGRPGAWAELMRFQRRLLGDAAAESLMAEHRARLQEFHQELNSRPKLPADPVLGLLSYALNAGDRDAWRHWDARFQREFPDHPWTVFRRENELSRAYSEEVDGAAGYLAAMEPLWEKISDQNSSVHGSIIWNALHHAQQTSNPEAFLRWVERYRSHGPVTPEGMWYIATQTDRWPELRDTKLRMLREALRLLEAVPGSYRALENGVERQRQENRDRALHILAELGVTLVAAGDTTAGMDTLALAASQGWNVQVFRTLAEMQFAIGDTAAALQSMARIASDPFSPSSVVDSARRRGGRHFEPATWETLVDAGSVEMAQRILSRSVPRSLRAEVHLQDRQGRFRTLEELRGRDATVVLFWSRWCGPAVEAIPDIEWLHGWLQERGVPLVTVVDEVWSDDLDRFIAGREISFPIYHDYEGEAKTAFNKFSTPEYYVLDRSGKIAVAESGNEAVQRIAREVIALQM